MQSGDKEGEVAMVAHWMSSPEKRDEVNTLGYNYRGLVFINTCSLKLREGNISEPAGV